jgi:hypothetical protein
MRAASNVIFGHLPELNVAEQFISLFPYLMGMYFS